MGNVEDFDPNLLKINKKSYKNNDIYSIGYITMKSSNYVKTKSVNLLHLIVSEADGHFEEKNGSKYLVSDSMELYSTDENKEVFKKVYKTLGRN